MTTSSRNRPPASAANEVVLRGRVTQPADARQLPSGTEIVHFRMSMPRARTAMTQGSRQTVDWIDCSAWTVKARTSVRELAVGDQVEVRGALRRRHVVTAGGPRSLVEIEVQQAKRLAQVDEQQSSGAEVNT